MDKLAERPPYVVFETRPVENRTKTLEANNGLPVYDDVAFVIITPPGSKDQIERIAAKLFEPPAIEDGEVLTMSGRQQIKLICSCKEARGNINIPRPDFEQEL